MPISAAILREQAGAMGRGLFFRQACRVVFSVDWLIVDWLIVNESWMIVPSAASKCDAEILKNLCASNSKGQINHGL